MNIHIHMASFYYQLYKKSGTNLQFIITSLASTNIMIKRYEIAVFNEEIAPIELLLQEEKEKLRKECQATGLKFNNREMNNACRILYTLKNISGSAIDKNTLK